jgi:hypothetical protein
VTVEFGSVLSAIGTIIVGLLGLLLKMINGLRNDFEKGLDEQSSQFNRHLEAVKDELLAKVSIPECAKDMKYLQKEIIMDVKELIREVKP